jgi:choice-of-anchor B domain-containing protein
MKIRYIYLFIYILTAVATFSQIQRNLRLLANINLHSSDGDYSACWGYIAPDGRQYGILGCALGTSFIDITDTNNIREVAYLPGLNQVSCCREMKTYSHYVYIVADGIPSGLQIADLQYLPDSVVLLNTFFFNGFTRGHTIQVKDPSDPYLYVNAGDYLSGGLFILDLTHDPVIPRLRGSWQEHVVHDCRIYGDLIFACNIYNPPGKISVIDASDKDSLVTISSWINLPQPGPHNIAISPDGRYAFVTDEINGNPRLLKIWNIKDLNNVVKIAEWQPPGITTSIIHNVELYGNYLFAAHYTAGLRVIDATNPAQPTEVAYYDTYPQDNGFTFRGCWGVYVFPDNKIIASDMQTGLYVFRADLPSSPITNEIPTTYRLRQNYPNPFNSSTVIEVDLPVNSDINLTVYNTTGQKIATIADGFALKGKKTYRFDPADLASGVYFCKLTVSGLSKVIYSSGIRMVYLK